MSLYVRSWLFLGWTLLVLLTMPLWWWNGLVPLLGDGPGAVAGLAVWLAHGIASPWLFRCPKCRTSPFTSGMLAHPWPNANCSGCGQDLGAA